MDEKMKVEETLPGIFLVTTSTGQKFKITEATYDSERILVRVSEGHLAVRPRSSNLVEVALEW